MSFNGLPPPDDFEPAGPQPIGVPPARQTGLPSAPKTDQLKAAEHVGKSVSVKKPGGPDVAPALPPTTPSTVQGAGERRALQGDAHQRFGMQDPKIDANALLKTPSEQQSTTPLEGHKVTSRKKIDFEAQAREIGDLVEPTVVEKGRPITDMDQLRKYVHERVMYFSAEVGEDGEIKDCWRYGVVRRVKDDGTADLCVATKTIAQESTNRRTDKPKIEWEDDVIVIDKDTLASLRAIDIPLEKASSATSPKSSKSALKVKQPRPQAHPEALVKEVREINHLLKSLEGQTRLREALREIPNPGFRIQEILNEPNDATLDPEKCFKAFFSYVGDLFQQEAFNQTKTPPDPDKNEDIREILCNLLLDISIGNDDFNDMDEDSQIVFLVFIEQRAKEWLSNRTAILEIAAQVRAEPLQKQADTEAKSDEIPRREAPSTGLAVGDQQHDETLVRIRNMVSDNASSSMQEEAEALANKVGEYLGAQNAETLFRDVLEASVGGGVVKVIAKAFREAVKEDEITPEELGIIMDSFKKLGADGIGYVIAKQEDFHRVRFEELSDLSEVFSMLDDDNPLKKRVLEFMGTVESTLELDRDLNDENALLSDIYNSAFDHYIQGDLNGQPDEEIKAAVIADLEATLEANGKDPTLAQKFESFLGDKEIIGFACLLI